MLSQLDKEQNPRHLKIDGIHDLISTRSQTSFNVASSILSNIPTLAGSYIQSIYTLLPLSSQSFLTDVASKYFSSAQQPIKPKTDNYSLLDVTPETLIALILPLLIFLFSMSGWPRKLWSGGRYSPFGASTTNPPTVSEDDYQYLGPDDIVDPPPRVHRANEGYGYSRPQHSPDILVLKHRGTTYPLHLPAFSIGEGDLKVGELRGLAAKETKTEDSRRVKLLYKGKLLKDDTRACRDEGLKQQSEIMCVISEPGSHEDADSSDSADSEEMLENGLGGPRVEVDGTIRGSGGSDHSKPPRRKSGHRSGRRKKNSNHQGTSSSNTSPRGSSGFLAPITDPSIPPLSSQESRHPSRAPSPARPPTASTAPPPHSTSSSPKPPHSPAKPKTPLETLDAISHNYHTNFLPRCISFTTHPPTDEKTRDLEYKKLSETVLQQVLLKLDAVVTDGDEELRAKRKQLVKETQDMLSKLDKISKEPPR